MAKAYSNRRTFATLPRTERGKPLVLGADPKGKNFLYTNGNSVIIRDLANPEIADVYTEHSCPVLVAKYSPSGFYISSADKSGKIRIWDTVNSEHILKNEFQPISGPIYDIAWSADNQRIVCVGEGREKFGHVFLADTGTSNGDISGQSRPVNTCDFKQSRPFRVITGSEDNTTAVYEGPPFKFKTTKTEHSRYVQSVRYSPDGVFWVSAGFDGKMYLYDGKDSELISEFVDAKGQAHGGGVYAVAWSGNGKQLLSASGDKTCKLWDVETRKAITTFEMGNTVDDQQLGCLWSGDFMLSVSLSGYINYLDPNSPSKPSRILKGHNKPITKMCVTDEGKTIVTGGSDGRVIEWSVADGSTKSYGGDGHGNQVNGLATVSSNRSVASVGLDDCLRFIDQDTLTYSSSSAPLKLKSQPKGVDNQDDLTAVATLESVHLVKNGSTIQEEKVDYEPSCVSISKDQQSMAVGDSGNDKSVHIYEINGGSSITMKKKIMLSGPVTDVAYSPDGKYLVSADGNRKVTLFKVDDDYEKANPREWGFHTARVNCLGWSPDSNFVASGGLDCNIIIWSVQQPEKHIIIKVAHTQSQITGIKWLDAKTIASCGQDGNVKVWDIDWQN